MLRITHIAYDEHENYYYIRFAGEPFYPMVEKIKTFGRARARFDPDYKWPDGRQKAWYIDADALESLTDCFFNLRYQMEHAREKYEQPPLWEEVAQDEEAIRQAQERARKAEEEARKRREEQRRAEERLRQEWARWQYTSSSTYAPARVQDALKVLGLSGRVTKDGLKQVHRKLMLLHHSDKHVLAPPDVRQQHEQQCKRINAANDIVFAWLETHEYVYA